MIRSDKELAVARRKLREAEDTKVQAEGIAQITLKRFAEDLRSQVEEFESIRSGLLTTFRIAGIDDLGPALIKARLAKGWTQRQLAESLEVSEQQVQKQEARSYDGASATRMAEVADLLEYELSGVLAPIGEQDGKQEVGSFALPVAHAEAQTWLETVPGQGLHDGRFRMRFISQPGNLIPADMVINYAVNPLRSGLKSGSMHRWTADPETKEQV